MKELYLPFPLAAGFQDLSLKLNNPLDLFMSEENRFQNHVLRQLVRARFDHHDRVLRAGNRQIEIRFFTLGERRVDDKLAAYPADPHPGDRPVERNIGDAKGARRADHRRDVRRIILFNRQDGSDDLNIVAKSLWEKRPNGAINEPGTQNRRIAWTTLPLDEAAGNFAYGVHFFLIIDGQREKINPFPRLRRSRYRYQDHGVAVTY